MNSKKLLLLLLITQLSIFVERSIAYEGDFGVSFKTSHHTVTTTRTNIYRLSVDNTHPMNLFLGIFPKDVISLGGEGFFAVSNQLRISAGLEYWNIEIGYMGFGTTPEGSTSLQNIIFSLDGELLFAEYFKGKARASTHFTLLYYLGRVDTYVSGKLFNTLIEYGPNIGCSLGLGIAYQPKKLYSMGFSVKYNFSQLKQGQKITASMLPTPDIHLNRFTLEAKISMYLFQRKKSR